MTRSAIIIEHQIRGRKRKQPVYVTPSVLLDKICRAMELDRVDVTSRSRAKRLIMARAMFSYLARERGMSLSDIGDLIDRDHSCITYYLKNFDDYLDANRPYFRPEVSNELERIRHRIKVMSISG